MNANYSDLDYSLASGFPIDSSYPLTLASESPTALESPREFPTREKDIFDVLASTIDQTLYDSQFYRLHGADSWTWGAPEAWIKIRWLSKALFEPDDTLLLNRYLILKDFYREVQISELERYYFLRNAQEVRAYLQTHPQLIQFLQESYKQLRRYFGSDADFDLELITDPEAEYQTEFLFVYIRTALDVDDALNRLEEFDEAWYLDRFAEFGALVNFNLEIYEL